MAAPAKADSQALPTRDLAAYKDITKSYDERQYKQAIKKADALLKKYPNHGDTTAMKALTLNSMGKKQEAMDLAKVALRLNLKSTTCWQVLGMIQRSQQNYAEAIKAFRQAWKLEPENFQIARDLAVVQMHIRDYQGSVETRQAILGQKGNSNFNMFMFGYAQALAGNATFANVVLDKFEIVPGSNPTAANPNPASNVSSDIALYRLRLLTQGLDPRRALIFAESPAFKSMVVDRLAADECRASLNALCGRHKEAAALYWALLAINPDHLEYAGGFVEAVIKAAGHAAAIPARGQLDSDLRAVSVCRSVSTHADPAVRDLALAACLLMVTAHPRCRTLKRLVLDVLPVEHPLFRPSLAAYIRFSLRKGIPSLFSDVRHVGRQPHARGMTWAQRVQQTKQAGNTAKAAVLLEVASSYYSSMVKGNSVLDTYTSDFSLLRAGLDAPLVAMAKAVPALAGQAVDLELVTNTKGDGIADSPDVVPWTAMLLSRMQDELGDPAAGIATLNEAVGHTPTVIDLLMAKARMLKHQGKHDVAADVMDAARLLDSADRHVNNKSVEYSLRAGRIEAAESAISLFVRHDAGSPEDPLAAMRTLQVSWYDLALGAAWEARGDLGPALTAYHRVLSSQESFIEDGMDYHVYCMRNFWCGTHHDMVAVNQAMLQHSNTLKAAEALARCYLKLHADPSLRATKERATTAIAAPLAPVPGAEADAKAKGKQEEKKKDEEEQGEGDKDKKAAFDYWGVSHVTVASPLEQARKYARMVVDGTPRAWAMPASTDLAQGASGAGLVSVVGADIDQPSVIRGGRSSGWQCGLASLAGMHATAAEVEAVAGKTAQAAAALQLALKEAAEDPSSVASLPGLQERLARVRSSLAAAASAAPPPVQAVAKQVLA